MNAFGYLLRSVLTMGAGTPQDFLGKAWVRTVVEKAPCRVRKQVALRVLSWSPHYFFDSKRRIWPPASVIRREDQRNAASRSQIVRDVIRPRVGPNDTVVDYGCGPGYMAVQVAPFVKRVIACDISDGVLACARALNGGDNIEYTTVRDLSHKVGISDLVYSFAVAQHLSDAVLAEVLGTLHRTLRPGGLLLLHLAVNAEGWKSESEWVSDTSLRGRLKLKYGMNCFSRSPEQVLELAEAAGFANCRLQPMAELTDVEDDVVRQHLLSCQA